MFADLPETLQQQVCDYLRANDFRSAKEIYDAWLGKKHPSEWDHPPTSV